jgi:hypothetical protein
MARLSIYEMRVMLVLSLRGNEAAREELLMALGRVSYLESAVEALSVQGVVVVDREREVYRLLPGRAAEVLGLRRIPVQQRMFSEGCLLEPVVDNVANKAAGGTPTGVCGVHAVTCTGDKEISQLPKGDLPWRCEQTPLVGRLKAFFESAATRKAVEIAARYRHDGYLMEKLAAARGLCNELMMGRTPTARKFAVLYSVEPVRAREMIGTALLRRNAPAALNSMLREEGVRY